MIDRIFMHNFRSLGPDTVLDLGPLTALVGSRFETWFLPCVAQMAGKPLPGPGGIERPGLEEGAAYTGNVEAIRGVKEWLSKHFAQGKAYKPTLDQLPLAQMLDLATLRAANVPSFGTFERALHFLASAKPGQVYPPPIG